MITEEDLISLAKGMLNDDPKTVRLCTKGIKEFPVECINFIAKDYKVERLGLEQNQLTSLPMEICNLTYLSYLNISYNAFKEFPEALCSMKNLEILDISRNKIRKMPDDFGTLISLKGLKISKNSIKQIPLYISEMKDLQYLKLDNNPIRFPPKSVYNMPKGEEKEVMLPWLENLKDYLRQHSNNFTTNKEVEVEESDHSSGEEDLFLHNYKDNKGLKKSVSSESMSYLMSTRMNAGNNLESSNSSLKTITEDENLSNKKPQSSSHERKRPTPKLSIDLPSMKRDRSYSNDFDPTTLNNNVQKNITRHSKSFSTDSISSSSTNSNNGNILLSNSIYYGGHYNNYHNQNYYILEERESENYFLKLKNSSPSEHLLMSDISLREASRNILYAFSQIHKALRQFANYTGNEKLFYIDLNKATTTIGQLSNTLSRFDMMALQSAPESELCAKLLNSCQENILCFKQIIDSFNKRLKGIINQSSDNMRYSRTLLLMLNGSIADIKFAWEIILPLLNDYTPYTGMSTPFRSRSMSRSNSTGGNNSGITASVNNNNNTNASGNGGGLTTPLFSAGINSNGSISPYSLNTPSTAGLPSSPYSPYPSSNNSDNSVNTNDTPSNGGNGIDRTLSSSPLPDIRFPINIFDQLISKVDVSIRNVESVVKNLSENLDKILFNSKNSDLGGGPGGEESSLNKIIELRNLVKNTMDITKKLKKSLLIPKLSSQKKEELSIQLKIHGDSIVFLQTTVKMSSLAKEVSLEFPLPNKVMSGLGHVTKTNIDLTNFLRAIESPLQPSSQFPFPSNVSNTPLSSSPILTPSQSSPNHSDDNSFNEIDDDVKEINNINDNNVEIEITKADNNDDEIKDSDINNDSE
ncbi:RAM signaling pathway protein [Glomus cerebriforme]|uniref:RAM signaling pathway protein n=1 Tax=Glomus cerebriforme TaxID=658196 RepID=A0A397T5L9_9GLOM|nr:RAM signaling pathway protein [Glomus cerebriforme]